MIRIDEIYYNIFLQKIQQLPYHSVHWFDPFGSTKFDDICSRPAVSSALPDDPNKPNHKCVRILFWDQEPILNETATATLSKFSKVFNTGTKFLVTSEYNSNLVETVCSNYRFIPKYYFFHGWAALDWYRGYNRSFLLTLQKYRTPTKTFLCPNNIIGGERKHRLSLLYELAERNILDDNLISFPESCPYEKKSAKELCDEYGIKFHDTVDLPLKIDNGKNYHSHSHQIDMWNHANDSLVHVVTETVYSGQRVHLTEKTFKPIVMQQPFIVLSCANSLEYLKMYGFKTFSHIWDETYDLENNDNLRIKKVADLLKHLNDLSYQEKQKIHKACTSTIEYNFNHFYNGNFEKNLWKELLTLLQSFDL